MNKSPVSFTDVQHLTNHSYKTPSKLNVRILTHQLYTQPKVDFTNWVLDKVTWQVNETAVTLHPNSGSPIKPGLARCY